MIDLKGIDLSGIDLKGIDMTGIKIGIEVSSNIPVEPSEYLILDIGKLDIDQLK